MSGTIASPARAFPATTALAGSIWTIRVRSARGRASGCAPRGSIRRRRCPGQCSTRSGGDPYGWAFTGNGIAGDSGAAAAIEVSHDVDTRLADPGVRRLWRDLWNQDAEAEEVGHDAIGSAGIGVAGVVGDQATATFLLTTPWQRPDFSDDPGTGVFFSLAVGF